MSLPGWIVRLIPLPACLCCASTLASFFTSSNALLERLIDLQHQAEPNLHTVRLNFEGVKFIDSLGATIVAAIGKLAKDRDIELRLAWVKTPGGGVAMAGWRHRLDR